MGHLVSKCKCNEENGDLSTDTGTEQIQNKSNLESKRPGLQILGRLNLWNKYFQYLI